MKIAVAIGIAVLASFIIAWHYRARGYSFIKIFVPAILAMSTLAIMLLKLVS